MDSASWPEVWADPYTMAYVYERAFLDAQDRGEPEGMAHLWGLRAIAVWAQPQNRKRIIAAND